MQRRDQNSTAREGHYSTKNPLNSDPGSVFNGGVKILSYTGLCVKRVYSSLVLMTEAVLMIFVDKVKFVFMIFCISPGVIIVSHRCAKTKLFI